MSNRIPEVPPVIAPVAHHINRPKWSVMIPTYNCITYLQKTLEAVLAQGISEDEMQIEVIDDFSTDGDVGALVVKVGKGRIGFYRQSENRGSLRNFETCINRSTGRWVHILHGDDLVKPGYYSEIEKLFDSFPNAGAAFTDYIYMDETDKELYADKRLAVKPGVIKDWLSIIAQTNRIQPPSIVVKRSVYEHLGSFFGVHYGEDWEMWVRISASYPIVYSPEYLALYRIHKNNISSRSYVTGQNLRDISKVVNIIQNYLPEKDKRKLKRRAEFNFASYFAINADKIYHELGSKKAAMAQVRGALQMSVNKHTLFAFMKIYFKVMIRY